MGGFSVFSRALNIVLTILVGDVLINAFVSQTVGDGPIPGILSLLIGDPLALFGELCAIFFQDVGVGIGFALRLQAAALPFLLSRVGALDVSLALLRTSLICRFVALRL